MTYCIQNYNKDISEENFIGDALTTKLSAQKIFSVLNSELNTIGSNDNQHTVNKLLGCNVCQNLQIKLYST